MDLKEALSVRQEMYKAEEKLQWAVEESRHLEDDSRVASLKQRIQEVKTILDFALGKLNEAQD
jgi:hypothetical protein